ncbi:dephospho-CoA kinase [Thiohalorhabdus methylotrophus]|uniref:Dephospho-CoA kinase n=1 Tax=Thiohalorhabdus methylotrophus TaxID=3242694 RepID=A0ABV4TQD2_9GAMM
MLLVGLTGGIGSGKSSISRAFAGRGAHILDADQLAREVLAPGSEVLDEVAAELGGDILTESGDLDRARLAERIFDDSDARATLDGILHPRINELARRRAAAIGDRFPKAVVLYDAALLLESGAENLVDRVLVVDADPETQVRRAVARGDRDAGQVRAIMAAQWSRERRLRHADDRIDNDGDWAETLRQVEELMERYRRLAGADGAP